MNDVEACNIMQELSSFDYYSLFHFSHNHSKNEYALCLYKIKLKESSRVFFSHFILIQFLNVGCKINKLTSYTHSLNKKNRISGLK